MTIDELIARLQEIKETPLIDGEETHIEADLALLEYINDERVSELHGELAPWYA
jgi:hypothetical protein